MHLPLQDYETLPTQLQLFATGTGKTAPIILPLGKPTPEDIRLMSNATGQIRSGDDCQMWAEDHTAFDLPVRTIRAGSIGEGCHELSAATFAIPIGALSCAFQL